MIYLFSILLLLGALVSAGIFFYTLYALFWNAKYIPLKKIEMKPIILKRIYRVIRNVFLQAKLFKDRSGGIMHAIMFWGFIAFGAYSLSFFYRGFFPDSHLIPAGVLKDAIFFTVDIFAAVLIADVIYSVFRRWIIKIPR